MEKEIQGRSVSVMHCRAGMPFKDCNEKYNYLRSNQPT